jgi:hypothetical protein
VKKRTGKLILHLNYNAFIHCSKIFIIRFIDEGNKKVLKNTVFRYIIIFRIEKRGDIHHFVSGYRNKNNNRRGG